MREEFETRYHVLYLGLFTGLYALLSLATWLLGWERRMIWVFIVVVVASWGIHFAKVWTGQKRLTFYALVSSVGILYCGYHPRTMVELPMVLMMMILILSVQRNMRLIYLVASYYPLLVLENIFLNHYLLDNRDDILYTRIGLGVFCLISVVVVARFFIRRDLRDNDALKKVQEKLAAAKGENEIFLSNVSHELRTPINAVNGISELLLRKGLSEEAAEDVRTIQDAGKRLMRQVGDIMDFSELQTGRFYVQNENYEPVSVLNDAVTAVFERDVKKRLEVAIDMEASVPKVLYGDYQKIYKILICILDNALKFTKEGGAYLYISKRDEEYGINLNIDLWDTGIGMTEGELKHLYKGEAYQTDAGSQRKIGGTGLGIAIVQGIVSAMDGFCTINSEKGRGSHIHISIPQQVRNIEPSIHMSNAADYRALVYFNTEKYTRPEIGEFYRMLVTHIREELRMDAREMASLEQLKNTVKQGFYTHVFVAEWEYEMDPEFFGALAERLNVAVFTAGSVKLPAGSRIRLLKKPVYIFSIINYLRESMEQKADKEKEKRSRGGSGKRIALVVDDDEMNLIVGRGIMENLGFKVDTANSGELAIRECQEKDYDVVLMDHMMPGLNGTETMKRIRELREGYYREVPILAVTANAVSSARADFLRAGFDEFVAKPIEIAVLKKALNRVIEEADYE